MGAVFWTKHTTLIASAALHALGKTIDGSVLVLDTCAIESGAYTSAALPGIFGGKS